LIKLGRSSRHLQPRTNALVVDSRGHKPHMSWWEYVQWRQIFNNLLSSTLRDYDCPLTQLELHVLLQTELN
jgi:hypothetical protein